MVWHEAVIWEARAEGSKDWDLEAERTLSKSGLWRAV